jgi:hypothetical protein
MDAIIYSEEVPENIYTGRVWIKLSTMSAYLRLGGQWIPIASGFEPFIEFQDITFIIKLDW